MRRIVPQLVSSPAPLASAAGTPAHAPAPAPPAAQAAAAAPSGAAGGATSQMDELLVTAGLLAALAWASHQTVFRDVNLVPSIVSALQVAPTAMVALLTYKGATAAQKLAPYVAHGRASCAGNHG